ncbi:hypothetical protein IV203_025777 [Nitzschia inconspicua]|uniref:Uncharacterized protein n=1 Tax=Nitzschia inconspicua TaxID=303405 RepID=A0A9K3PWM9_9STRA|nr:hypothetical protein IV203_025777 [Nitzschia inconspicua]
MRTSPQRRRYSNEGLSSSQNSNIHNNNNDRDYRMKSSLLNFDEVTRTTMEMEDDLQQQQQQQQHLFKSNNSQVLDTIVNAAQVYNSIVSDYCGLCNFYIDQQVQYELISNTATSGGASASTNSPVLPSSAFDLPSYDEYYLGVQGRSKAAQDVAHAAMLLFDEESVVESVSSR